MVGKMRTQFVVNSINSFTIFLLNGDFQNRTYRQTLSMFNTSRWSFKCCLLNI